MDCSSENSLEDILDAFKNVSNKDIDLTALNDLNKINLIILEKVDHLKKGTTGTDDCEKLTEIHKSTITLLSNICNTRTEEIRSAAFKVLTELLPFQSVLGKRNSFPDHHFADILKIVIYSKTTITPFLPTIEELLKYPDISRNIWRGLEIACYRKLCADELKNVLEILNLTEKPKPKDTSEFGPQLYFCRISDGVHRDKEISTYIKRLWGKLASVDDLPPKLMQSLLLALLEKLMPRMHRPMQLTDYFMSTLELGGSISILALQGIFFLYKDENMNYPNVYRKLYSMVTPELLEAHYKSRFYYLADIFLSSSHLPEALVAGFIKKFARLSLVAQPVDAIIMLTFIVNLLIRHRGLKKLVHNPTGNTYESDPFDEKEAEPEQSGAVDSSLWEVQLLKAHVLPAVSAAASFIHKPLPKLELDLSAILDDTTDEMFVKEYKKKMKNPPVSFEKPNSVLVPHVQQNIFHLWDMSF